MIAAVFPGQGSQKPGMGQSLFDAYAEARNVFAEVREATGVDAEELCFRTDEETLRQTENAQLALFTVAVAAHRCHPVGDFFAGHSVGEYAALVASGTLSLADGARLVQRRGLLMAEAGRIRTGTMAAVVGLDRELVERICVDLTSDAHTVVVANDNCPGQLVISGDREAVLAAMVVAKSAGAKLTKELNVSGAFHSPLMRDSATVMGDFLKQTPFVAGLPTVSNVTAQVNDEPEAWSTLLQAQLEMPVRWTESVQTMIQAGVQTFIEFGVGEVLSGLIKRIDPNVDRFVVAEVDDLNRLQEALTP